jgi:uncharacterized protein
MAKRASRGFEDVVATLHPIPEDRPYAAARWSVTFSVDDADPGGQTSRETGGQVVVPPFDAPFVRMTVITGPQSPTLTASRFVPER